MPASGSEVPLGFFLHFIPCSKEHGKVFEKEIIISAIVGRRQKWQTRLTNVAQGILIVEWNDE